MSTERSDADELQAAAEQDAIETPGLSGLDEQTHQQETAADRCSERTPSLTWTAGSARKDPVGHAEGELQEPGREDQRVKLTERRAFRINVLVVASLVGLTLLGGVAYLAVTLGAWNARVSDLEGIVSDLDVLRDESSAQATAAQAAREQSEIDLLASLESKLQRRYQIELAEEFGEDYDYLALYLTECAKGEKEHIDFVLQIGYYTYSSVRAVGDSVNEYCRDIDAEFDAYIATEAAELAELAAAMDAS